ncbi:hypothetical protein U1Q18_013551 [Sarracenia purpurea var. burkii]
MAGTERTGRRGFCRSPSLFGPPLPQHRWKAGYERESGRRRDLVFTAAVAAVCSVVGVAAAVETKRGTSDAKKIYAPVRVTMPTARICHKSDLSHRSPESWVGSVSCFGSRIHTNPQPLSPDLGFALSNPATSMDCASPAPCLRSVNPGLGFLTNRWWAGAEGYIAI